jgi:hypothetical protein
VTTTIPQPQPQLVASASRPRSFLPSCTSDAARFPRCFLPYNPSTMFFGLGSDTPQLRTPQPGSAISTPSRSFADIVRSSLTIHMHFHLPRVSSFSNLVDQVRDVMRHHKHEKESEAHQVRSLSSQPMIALIDPCRFIVKLVVTSPKVSPRQWIR